MVSELNTFAEKTSLSLDNDDNILKKLEKIGIKKGANVHFYNDDFRKGQEVIARYDGKMYKGVILDINKDKTYYIKFNDGYEKKSCIEKDIQPIIVDYTIIDINNNITIISPFNDNSIENHIEIETYECMNHFRAISAVFTMNNRTYLVDEEATRIIIDAYFNDKQAFYTVNGSEYTLKWCKDFKSNQFFARGLQTNVNTGTELYIWLFFLQNKKIISEKCKVINYLELPKEYKNIIDKLKPCFKKKLKIYHTEPYLFGKEMLELQKKRQRKMGLSDETKVLVHGCSAEATLKIVTERMGFQDVGTINEKVYGNGVYFSSDPNYSATNYSSVSNKGRQFMMLCSVLIGGKKETDRDFKYFTTNKVRTGGSLGHIYMKPWRYVESDVNIAYVIEF